MAQDSSTGELYLTHVSTMARQLAVQGIEKHRFCCITRMAADFRGDDLLQISYRILALF